MSVFILAAILVTIILISKPPTISFWGTGVEMIGVLSVGVAVGYAATRVMHLLERRMTRLRRIPYEINMTLLL